MTGLVEIFLSTVELIKAELQKSRINLIQLWWCFLLLAASAAYLVAGFALLLVAVFMGIAAVSGDNEGLAALVTAIASFLVAVLLYWVVKQIEKS